MRILYHHRTLGDGAEGIHIAEMVNAFEQSGHEVRLIGPAERERETSQKNTSSLFSSLKKKVRGPAYEMMELAYNIYGYATIRDAIKKFKPHFIYDRYITYNYSAVGIGKIYDIPVFLEVNAPLAYERDHESDEKLYFKQVAYSLEKKICCDSFRTIVVSTPLKEYLVSIGVPSDHIIVMPNGVNLEKFFPVQKDQRLLRQHQISPDNIVIGFTGILRPWHGIDLLLESFRAVHEIYPYIILLLVGDGPIRNDIEAYSKKIGCSDAVRITGRVPHDVVKNYVALFDIAVSPKATFYASPMKILEYMAMGKPVVAPDTANIRDIIENGRTGILFKESNADSMAESICSLIVKSTTREQVSINALSEVEFNKNWLNNAKEVINLLTGK